MSCAEIDIGICPRRDRRVRLETRGKRSYGCGARTTVSRARKLAPQRIGHYAHEGATVTGPGAIGRRGRGGSQHLPILEIAKITLSSVPVGGNGLLALIATAGYLPLHMRHVVYTLRGACPPGAKWTLWRWPSSLSAPCRSSASVGFRRSIRSRCRCSSCCVRAGRRASSRSWWLRRYRWPYH